MNFLVRPTLVTVVQRLIEVADSIQDAVLLAMLCVSAECEHVPPGVKDTVRKLAETSGRPTSKVSTIYTLA